MPTIRNKQSRTRRARRSGAQVNAPNPEIAARRQFLAGRAAEAKTEYPLGIMLVNGIVSQDQHDAGLFYALLYGRFVGKQIMGAVPPSAMGMLRDLDDGNQARCERLYREARAAVGNPEAMNMLDDALVFLKAPTWIMPRLRTVAEVGDQRVFIAALGKLARWRAQGKDTQSVDRIRAMR